MRTITLNATSLQIGIFGSGPVDEECYELARKVGAAVSEKGHIVINGGHGGVMEASGHGATEANGLVVGVMLGDALLKVTRANS